MANKNEQKKGATAEGQVSSHHELPTELMKSNGTNNERKGSLKEGTLRYRKEGQVFSQLDNLAEECPEFDEMDMLRTTCYGFK